MRHAPLVALLAASLGACACVDLTPPLFGSHDGGDAGDGGMDGGVSDAPAEMVPGDAGDGGDAPVDMSGDGATDGIDAPPDAPADRTEAGPDVVPEVGPDAPPAPRLVGYWRLDGFSNSLTPDSSNFGHPGTVTGNPVIVTSGLPSIPGGGNTGAFSFPNLPANADDAVRIADSPELRPAKLTIALWVRFAATTARRLCGSAPANFQYIIHRRNSRGTNQSTEGYALVRQGDNTLGFILTAGSSIRDVVSSTMTVPTGIWMHVAATYDGDMMRLYVNGVLQAGSPRPHTGPLDYDPAAAIYLGRSGECGEAGSVTTYDAFLNGMLDDVRIYDADLSGSAIADLAAGRS